MGQELCKINVLSKLETKLGLISDHLPPFSFPVSLGSQLSIFVTLIQHADLITHVQHLLSVKNLYSNILHCLLSTRQQAAINLPFTKHQDQFRLICYALETIWAFPFPQVTSSFLSSTSDPHPITIHF